ncbi:DedA family protein [Gordonia sp. (in: high G+C Gram-positive bacteria)]|uniref:DedA family protein n=1 Tax=Gordonia sp. (in: high G+C Gram-positive bacteria) TaxID=84139 RepID=UPI003C733071
MGSLSDRLTELVGSAPAWAVYLVAFSIVYFETAMVLVGLVVPSEAVLIAAGVVAAVGKPSIVVLVLGCAVAAVAGDTTGYAFGRLAGPRLSRTQFGRRMARRAVRSGYQPPPPGAAIASARWVAYVRSVTPLLAGARRMPFTRFLCATAIGGISWTATILLISYGVGATLGANVALIVGISVGAVAFGFLVFRRVRERRASS